jgi:cysteine desulfurase
MNLGKTNDKVTRPIYLDYNATTPHDSEVIEAMRPYLEEHFGNPSSSHWYGIQTKNAIENARRQVASLLNCQPDEIVFTSGGTESNNYAIKGTAFARRNKGNHIITTQIEHPAVIEVCKFLEENGFEVSYLPVDEFGLINVSDIEKAITPQTILITIMHANNEVGTIQPIEHISKLAKEHEIIIHTDAAQSIGKIPTDVNVLSVDLLSVAGHKLYAPKGVGVLYMRRGLQMEKLIHGAGHEQGRRAGTENVLEIVGLGKACEIAKRDLEKNISHMREMRDRLHNGLREKLKHIKLNGHPEKRLPNTLSLGFLGIDADTLLSKIKDNIAASAGAACHSNGVEISYVLKAMNVPIEWARGTLRFSTGRMTTESEIENAVNIISDAVMRLRNR